MNSKDREAQELFMKIFVEAVINLAEIEERGTSMEESVALAALDRALFSLTDHQLIEREHMRELTDRACAPKRFAPTGKEIAWILTGLSLLEMELEGGDDEFADWMSESITNDGVFEVPSEGNVADFRRRLLTVRIPQRPSVAITIGANGEEAEIEKKGDVDVKIADLRYGRNCHGCKQYFKDEDLGIVELSPPGSWNSRRNGYFCKDCLPRASELIWAGILKRSRSA